MDDIETRLPSADAAPPEDRSRAARGISGCRRARGSSSWEDRARVAERRADEAERRTAVAHRRIEQLTRALDSRPRIDQAKGILMAAFLLDADAAFQVLVWVSQHSQAKLSLVAERFVDGAGHIDAGSEHRQQLVHLLAVLGNSGLTPHSVR